MGDSIVALLVFFMYLFYLIALFHWGHWVVLCHLYWVTSFSGRDEFPCRLIAIGQGSCLIVSSLDFETSNRVSLMFGSCVGNIPTGSFLSPFPFNLKFSKGYHWKQNKYPSLQKLSACCVHLSLQMTTLVVSWYICPPSPSTAWPWAFPGECGRLWFSFSFFFFSVLQGEGRQGNAKIPWSSQPCKFWQIQPLLLHLWKTRPGTMP